MAELVKRDQSTEVAKSEVLDPFGPIDRVFERFFGPSLMPWPIARRLVTDRYIPLDEFHRDGKLVIRAEMPGIDPDRDVEVTISSGVLHITAHRREETNVDDGKYARREIRYGTFERNVPLPEGVTDAEIAATYTDGILEITVPEGRVETTRVAITKK